MESFMGKSLGVFVVVTGLSVLLSYMAAKSCALGWKSLHLALVYGALIVFANRFLLFALRGATFLDPVALIVTTAALAAVIVGVYHAFRAEIMVKQYPWLYERTGKFTCRHKVTETTSFL